MRQPLIKFKTFFSKEKGLVLALLMFCNLLQAQLHNNGILHVASNTVLYINSGTLSFGSTSSTTTSKALPYVSTDGKICIGPNAGFTTDGTNTKFINGYTETKNTTATNLPIGSGTVYAPIQVTPADASGVKATYINDNPLVAYSGGLAADVTAVGTSDYWIITGVNSVISLSWRTGSGLSTFSYPDLSIVGYKNGKWEIIDSAIDATSKFGGTSSMSGSGSITSSSAVNLSQYAAFAIGEKGVTCVEVVSSGLTRTWNGSAWSTTPTLTDAVTLNANYSGGSFQCYALNLNGYDVNLSGTQTLEVVDGVTGSGTIKMTNESNLVQYNAGGAKPTIELTRTTRSMRRYDYVYWGTPVVENVFSQLNNAIATGVSTAGAFDFKYKYVSGDLTTAGGWQNLTSTSPGKGFITRVKQQAPFVDGTATATIDLKFTGTANNGDVTVAVAKVAGDDVSARNNNLLANPYPSAIDADKFLTVNNDIIDGAIYLWRANTSNSGAAGETYSVADYIAYTKAGSTAYSGTSSSSFNGKIAAGQGFKVRALASGNITFTNCMRVAGNNGQFYRTNSYAQTTTQNADRFLLKLKSNNEVVNQIVVAYLTETTLEYDNMYDAQLLTSSPTNLYSMLDDGSRKLVINARPTFIATDVVKLGVAKAANLTSSLYIDIAQTEGIFSNNQPIYLYDTVLNNYHNFANGAYEFTTTVAQDNDRFKIVYQNSSLGNVDHVDATTYAILSDNNLKIQASTAMELVNVYDITGRLVSTLHPTDTASTTLITPFNQAQGVYLVKVKLINGQIVTTKLLNR